MKMDFVWTFDVGDYSNYASLTWPALTVYRCGIRGVVGQLPPPPPLWFWPLPHYGNNFATEIFSQKKKCVGCYNNNITITIST